MNRFLWAAQGDLRRLRLAALCQFTLSGPPVIYYGTEVGLSQARDVRQDGRGLPEESRLPMLWGSDQDADLLDYYRRLIHLRREIPALMMGGIQIVESDREILVYTRGDAVELLVVLNLSMKKQKISTLDQWDKILLQTNSGDVQLGNFELTIAPLGGAILVKRI
jgi:glycosidase